MAAATGQLDNVETLEVAGLPARVRELESHSLRVRELDPDSDAPPPRFVWAHTPDVAEVLLPAGVRVRRCLDLSLCHAILRQTPTGAELTDWAWKYAPASPNAVRGPGAEEPPVESLFDDLSVVRTGPDQDLGPDLRAVHAEWVVQQQVITAQPEPARMRLLLAAESAGALIAAEMRHDGLPWDREVHDGLLTAMLGPRPRHGERPGTLHHLAEQIRTHLNAPRLNPDSPTDLLRTLRAQGLPVNTTRKWELAQVDHPVVAPLLEYKKLARLLSAYGWAWLDEWVTPAALSSDQPAATNSDQPAATNSDQPAATSSDQSDHQRGHQHAHDPPTSRRGRFRPQYVPGGVVTGRWATSGGGALQLPKQVRAAVRADAGWQLVVADAAQIEPRVLAAMAGDAALADAGRGGDLYQGLVDAGVVPTRDAAKVAMLGALYGGTSGDSGALMPRLRRAYPEATALVEHAALEGERGRVVRTWLGRTSPPPSEAWQELQRAAGQVGAADGEQRRARAQSREWGRFTRNFVVQGTAAEWALCWLAEIRRRLPAVDPQAHLVFFLHDEVIVHCPASTAPEAAEVVREAATAAGRLLFGPTPADFPVSVAVVDDYAQARDEP
ncbi:MAG TPA: bifunctional 3'-5' exonuclease/DNA polymerase [Beutenbergiaceae bacterium]|nr:bifunctional 3'-5' exonuclease/DNA polymerase [Beutenbergiaceae bacterium]